MALAADLGRCNVHLYTEMGTLGILTVAESFDQNMHV